jgi:hypothetical protein
VANIRGKNLDGFVQYPVLDIFSLINPLTPNDLQRRRAVSPLKIKFPSKNVLENPTNTPVVHSGY